MLQKIPYTTRRSGVFYAQFWCNNQLVKTSLRTDSAREAQGIMASLNPHIVNCINNRDSPDNLKRMVREIIKMKDEDKLMEDYAISQFILRSAEQSKSARYQLMDESPYSLEETINAGLEITNMLKNPLNRFKFEKQFVDSYLERPENAKAINQGEKTKEQLKLEAQKRWHTVFECIEVSFNTMSYQDENVNPIITKHTVQSDKAFNELKFQYTSNEINTTAIEYIEESEKFLLSDLHQEHIEYKEEIFSIKSKNQELTTNNKAQLRRYNKYYMKFRAVAGNIDILSTPKNTIFQSLISLFDWPDENQAGSPYNTKTKENRKISSSQVWYDNIAIDLDEIAEDEAIEKSKGTVAEILGWLQELYKYAVTKEYIISSPVTMPTEKYKIMAKQAKRIRTAYSSDEVSQIIDYVTKTNHRSKWPIMLMCYTGCRNSELYRITKNDINIETKSIYIDGTKTESAKRHIPLAKGLERRGFLKFIENKNDVTPILKGVTPFHLLNQDILEINEKLGIPEIIMDGDTETFRSFYSFRKSFRTYATYNCANSDLIEILIGHKISGNDMKATYQDARLLAKHIEPLRPIVDELPW